MLVTRDGVRDFVAHHDDRWLFVAVYITLAVVLSLALSLFWLVAVAALHFGLECLRQAQHRDGAGEVLSHAAWEIKLDIALVLLALAMALYMDVVLGVLGLQSAARATAASRAGLRVARFAAWQRNVRAIILLGDDVARIIHVAVTRLLRRPARPAPQLSMARADAAVPPGTGGMTAAAAQPGIPAAARPAAAAVPAGMAAGSAAASAASGSAGVPAISAAGVPRSWRDAWTRGDRFTLGLLAASLMLIVLAPFLTDHTVTGATFALMGELRPFPPR
jgi:hypothetical protein